MLLKRALFIGLFLFAGMALAGHDPQPTARKPVPDRPSAKNVPSPSGSQASPSGEAALVSVGNNWVRNDPGLAPRKPTPKTPTAQLRIPQDATGKLIIKFRDEIKARPTADGTIRSLANRNLDEVQAIIDQFEVSLSRLINHPDGKLAELEARAAAHSGKAQPDLAGMMYVEGAKDDATLLAIAKALNDLANVEFVEFEVPPRAIGAPRKNAAAAPRSADSGEVISSGELVERANDAFNVSESRIVTLDAPANMAGPVEVEIPLEAFFVTLELRPHSVRADDFQMLEAMPGGVLVPIDPGPEQTFRGEIRGIPGSVAAGSLLENGLAAMILLPNGKRYWVQPIANRVDGAAPGQHIIYRSDDVEAPFGICGVDDSQAEPPPGFDGAGGGGVAGPCLLPAYAEIALDLDFAWIEKAGSVADAALLASAVINVVNIQYERDVGISHVITTIIARTTAASDPYTSDDPFILLTEFENEWNANNSGIRRDVAHLLTGRDLSGGVIGVAFVFGMCNEFEGDSISYSLAQQFSSFACQTDLSAHELGHNWGAFHCVCVPPFTDEPFTMNPFITCANKFNPDLSAVDIAAFRDFLTPLCLDCDPPPLLGCGQPAAGRCDARHVTPYCDDTVCCGTVCAVDSSCCETDWDSVCVALADELCTGCGQSNAGDCLSANLTPGCEDPDCCDAVIAAEIDFDGDGEPDFTGESCGSFWDEKCAILSRFFCFSTGLEDTPDLTAFQAYRTAEPTSGFELLTLFTIGGMFRGEGFDLGGLWALGQDLLNQGVGTANLTRGKTIKVASIEDAFYLGHEDLDVILEPGQTMFLNEEITAPSHGTATLGIMAAPDNGFGVTGIASDAQAYFFPSFSLEEGGRLPTAIISALMTFGPGDVLNFSIGFPFGPFSLDCDPGTQYLTSSGAIYPLIRLGSDLGITSVLSAGNSCCNLDTTSEAGDDSGAIIVSACDPGVPYCRRAFSNHSADPDSPIPHLSAWGVAMATTGGSGDLFGPTSNPNRQYTMSFSGTSASAPMIAGAVASLQGLIKQFYGITLMPEQVRDNFAGFTQCLLPIGSEALLGSADPDEGGGACDGDTLPQDPEDDEPAGTPNYIALFPEVVSWAGILLTNSWFTDSPLIDDITILRGNLVYGNVFSIKASDNNYLVIESEYTTPSHSGSGPENPQYVSFGEVTDVLVTAHGDLPGASALQVEVESHTSSGTSFMFVELWDWDWNRYTVIGFALLGLVDPPFDEIPAFPVGGAARYINQLDQRVLIRVWTLSVGGNSPPGFGLPPNSYRVHHDLINLGVFEDFGDIFEPNP